MSELIKTTLLFIDPPEGIAHTVCVFNRRAEGLPLLCTSSIHKNNCDYISCTECCFNVDISQLFIPILRGSNEMTNESPVKILENLIKFIDINSERLSQNKSTICRTEEGVTIRDNLPCSGKNDQGEYKIKCEDCPFSSIEAGEETKLELLEIIEREKIKDLLLQRE